MSIIYRRGGKQRHKLKVTTREREREREREQRQRETDRQRETGKEKSKTVNSFVYGYINEINLKSLKHVIAICTYKH